MADSFGLEDTIIPVMVDIEGPKERRVLRFALDTASTQTGVRLRELSLMGFSEPAEDATIGLATGSGELKVSEFSLPRITALGHTCSDFLVLGVPIPERATFDRVLGKDFFRGKALTIDFRIGTIELQ